MNFVGESFAFLWSSNGIDKLSIRSMENNASRVLGLDLPTSVDPYEPLELGLTFSRYDHEDWDVGTEIAAGEWDRLGLGDFQLPDGRYRTSLTWMDDRLSAQVGLMADEFDQLFDALKAYSSSHGPKFFWGRFLGNFRFDARTSVEAASEDLERAFFEDLVPLFSGSPPVFWFSVGVEMPDSLIRACGGHR
ncbi:hypothetical protein LVO79_21190 (plasmid) [Roseivivax marinus]|uniref:hypothetical protein n=1 Tax=Roseivivax marinus TaxID=1379903 RepID=UPI001F045579|nr:hypothetical protein [Roseivivax marinus]UMA67306.1 hypothetical protein LVO79_21190 [Roseivivax marinus]